MGSLIDVHNEWDPLEEIIVGKVNNAQIPIIDKGLRVVQCDEDNIDKIKSGKYSDRIIKETEEDLEILVDVLKQLKIKVRRPMDINHSAVYKTPDWESDGMYNYCPRDLLLPIGDAIIEAPMSLRSRYFESYAYKDFLIECLKSGSKWISAPKPRLLDSIYNDANDGKLNLNNLEPVFDAANVLRAGKDIFYLVSSSGNKLGAVWLQSVLGDGYKVHVLENLYSFTHIDTTITLIREGLMLINPERVCKDNMPKCFSDWEIISAPEMVDIGYTDVAYGSTWIGMNMLMINPNLAIVCKHQKMLIELLRKYHVDVIPLELRHARTLGGGFHCVTLDTKRRSKII